MNGADHEIKRIGEHQIVMLFAQIGLEPQLDSDGKINLAVKTVFYKAQAAEVFFRIEFEKDAAVCVIVIHMICQAQMPDAAINGALNHELRRYAAVAGKRGVDMIVR